MSSTEDVAFLRRAVRLARRGAGFVEPNPRVGAVVVRRGRVVGEGWHRAYGGAHAEVEALRAAGPRSRGATLYVTLEPCSREGKTGPCTEAIRAAGIRRVVAGAIDPHPRQRGRGLAALRRAGILVERQPFVPGDRGLNPHVPRVLASRRPWVILKWALTLDGKVATRTGDARWISGDRSRAEVHRLRGRVEAIVTGIGTVLRDDPRLTARPPGPLRAMRVVVDSSLRIPVTSRLVRTVREVPVIVAARGDPPRVRRARLEREGVEVWAIRGGRGGISLATVLHRLRSRGVARVLIEAGPTLVAQIVAQRLFDGIWGFWSPVLVGGTSAPSAVGGPGIARMAAARRVHTLRVRRTGEDVWVQAFAREEDLPREAGP